MSSQATALDRFAIQNTIARYCLALDSKDWKLLEQTFTDDVEGDYPFNKNMKGLDAVSQAIQGRLGKCVTQHGLTTQHITMHSSTSASAITYFTGCHFGSGEYQGQVLTAWGKYIDELVTVPGGSGAEGEQMSGSNGFWRIKKRTVGFFYRVGDEKLMDHSR